MEPKPGWKTTEFWLSLAGAVVPLVMAGLALVAVPDDSAWAPVLKIVMGGLAPFATWLVANGYTRNRSQLKAAQAVEQERTRREVQLKRINEVGP